MNKQRAALAGITLFSILFLADAGSGQLAPASAATLGTGGNYMALARGFAAIGLNPAGLGMPGSTDFSLAIFSLTGSQSLTPVTLSDLAGPKGGLLSASMKSAWMDKIASTGGETGGGAADATYFSFNAGPVGIQATTLVRARARLNEAASELLLFGNAGQTGSPEDFNLTGSDMNAMAVSTVGIGFGFPVELGHESGSGATLALGATLKYSVGNVLVLARDAGSEVRSDPLEVAITFPMIQSDTADFDPDHGRGVGLDVGVAWERGPWSAGAAVLNVFHTFAWEPDGMFYRSGEAFFDGETSRSDFEAMPGDRAPPVLREAVEALKFKPQLSLGAAYEAAEDLTIAAGLNKRFGEGIEVGPEFHLGVGMEYLGLGVLPLRLGAAKVTGGFQFGGGLSLVLGPVNLSWAGALKRGDEEGGMASLTLSFGQY